MARYVNTLTGERLGPSPRPGERRLGYVDDFSVESGRLRLAPAKLGRILKNADAGNVRELVEMFSAVEEDPHIHSVLQKRRRQIVARTMQIRPPRSMAEDPAAIRAVELCQRLVLGEGGESGIAAWDEALWDMTSAIGRCWSVQQIVWEPSALSDVMWQPVAIRHWPQNSTTVGDPWRTTHDNRRSDEVRILTAEHPVRGEMLEPGQWICHVAKARTTGLHKAALLRIVCWYYLFKHFGVKDWAIFCERYGMPIRVGKHPKNALKPERESLKKAVIELGKDAGVVLPVDSTIELVEQSVNGQVPYPLLARFCDEQISKAVLGNTLTTEATERGARSLGQVHYAAEIDLADQDGLRLAHTIRRDLLTPIVRFNMGEDAPVPHVDFLAEEEDDLNVRSERDARLVEIGLPIGLDYFYETYGVPRPADGDELIAQSPATPTAPTLDG